MVNTLLMRAEKVVNGEFAAGSCGGSSSGK